MNTLQGKTAIVTGAGQGIGLSIARALAAEGADVVGGARSVTDDLATVAPQSITADLSDPDGPNRVVEHTLEQFGAVDVLVNNVGAFTARTEGFAAVSDQDWQHTLDVNFLSAVRAIRAALPSLLERRGTIVTIGSVNARLPQPPVIDYAAAKAALINLTGSLAEELGPHGVQVTTVSPGPTASPAWTERDGFGAALAKASGSSLEDFLEGFPEQANLTTGRLTEPDEVAAVVTLIASGRVPNAHGADWIVDGGQTKQL